MKKTKTDEPLVHLGLRAPESLHRRLVELAKSDHRSLSDQIIYMLKFAVEAYPNLWAQLKADALKSAKLSK